MRWFLVAYIAIGLSGCSKNWARLEQLALSDGSAAAVNKDQDAADTESPEAGRGASPMDAGAHDAATRDAKAGSTRDAASDAEVSQADACVSGCSKSCGDGHKDPGEECDLGDKNSDSAADTCRENCKNAHCGDGVRDKGEACDDGSANSNNYKDACRQDCKAAHCGDGVRDSNEACDDGDANSDSTPDACRSDCTAPRCGDGIHDSNEACDNGAANSDSMPDACRSDCSTAHCNDGVLDAAEQCDNGSANSDTTADACRRNCMPPGCGDSVRDSGEECDDGNSSWGDTCFECSARHYFVLNAPSTSSAGNDSITRMDKRGHSVVIVPADLTLNGMRTIEVEPDGSMLYALQSHFSLMQHRVIFFNPLTGAKVDEVKLDSTTLGYNATPSAMSRGVNGMLYVIVSDSATTPDVRLVLVNPATKAITPAFGLGSSLGLAGARKMTRDDSGLFFVTVGSSVIRISPAYTTVSTFADSTSGLSSPFGIDFDRTTNSVWVGDISAGKLFTFSSGGGATGSRTINGITTPQVRGLLIDNDGTPLVPLGDQDKVVSVAANGTLTDVWTQNIDWPVDVKVVDLASSH